MLSGSLEPTDSKIYPFRIKGTFDFLFESQEEANKFMKKLIEKNKRL